MQVSDQVQPFLSGEIFLLMEDGGKVVLEKHIKNLIVYDAALLIGMLLRAPDSRPLGLNMLAVGTGATGAILSPNAPDKRQRKLNAELARKSFSSTTFRSSSGEAVAYPTNVIDFTCSFGEGEAVGPINEMGLMGTVSANPSTRNPNPNAYPTRNVTVDVSELDILLNYITCAPISKPATARLTITWRITLGT
jgi:hypothetical protein